MQFTNKNLLSVIDANDPNVINGNGDGAIRLDESTQLISSISYSLNKTLLASFSIFLIAHFSDITYYDGKISILFSVLLAGLKNVIDENIELKQ